MINENSICLKLLYINWNYALTYRCNRYFPWISDFFKYFKFIASENYKFKTARIILENRNIWMMSNCACWLMHTLFWLVLKSMKFCVFKVLHVEKNVNIQRCFILDFTVINEGLNSQNGGYQILFSTIVAYTHWFFFLLYFSTILNFYPLSFWNFRSFFSIFYKPHQTLIYEELFSYMIQIQKFTWFNGKVIRPRSLESWIIIILFYWTAWNGVYVWLNKSAAICMRW